VGLGGGRRRLGELIRRYRAEVRADLLEVYGVDLALWWRARRFRPLLELVDQLPMASRLNEAVQNDPDQARLIAEARQNADPDEGEPWSPRLAEFDLHAMLLRDVIQALSGVQAAVIAAAGGKPKPPPPYPAPVTEVDRAIARANRAWADSIINIFTPNRGATL
jgi:hypothetical protein